jgi:excisionase family DNA binding protein
MVVKPMLYRIDQVMEILQKSKATVHRLICDGELTAHGHAGKKGLRVTAESVDAYVERHKIPTEAWGE